MDIVQQVKDYMSYGLSLDDARKKVATELHIIEFPEDMKARIKREIEFDKHIRKEVEDGS